MKLINILFFGSIWGFLEATLGGALHFANFAITGQVMGAIGIGVLYMAMSGGAKTTDLIGISAFAASFKFIDCVLFPLPVFHITIINPAQAIMMEGVAFAAVVFFYKKAFYSSLASIVSSSAVLMLAMVLFNLFSYFIVGYKITGHMEDVSRTIFIHWPIGTFLSLAAVKLVGFRPVWNISLIWRTAIAITLAAASVIIRGVIV